MNLNENHPWRSARDEFNSIVLPKLVEIGMQIGRDAENGNESAAKVIYQYTLLRKSFDPITFIQLKEALETYERSKIPT